MNAVTFSPIIHAAILQFAPHFVITTYRLEIPQTRERFFQTVMSEEGSTPMKRPKHLRRRSSLETIIYICNQGYQVFPHVFLRVQDFQTTLGADLRKIIPCIKALLVLRLGVYFSVCFLSVEAMCCLMFILRLPVIYTSFFLLGCIGLLSLLAFQIFDVISTIRRKFCGSFFVKKKTY